MTAFSCPACKSAYVRHVSDENIAEDRQTKTNNSGPPQKIHYIISSYKCLEERCKLNYQFKYKLYKWKIENKQWISPFGGYMSRS